MRPIDAVQCADMLSDKLNINIGDLVDVFAEIPTLDVVPREEVAKIFEEIDAMIDLICVMTGVDIAIFGKYAELKKKYTEDGK